MIILYFVTAAALAFLMSRLRTNQRMLSVRERRMTLLYNFSQELSLKHSIPEIVQTSLERISKYFEAECILFLREGGDDDREDGPLAPGKRRRRQGVRRCPVVLREPAPRAGNTPTPWPLPPTTTSPSSPRTPRPACWGSASPRARAWPHDQDAFLQTLGRNLSLSVERELLAGGEPKEPHGARV